MGSRVESGYAYLAHKGSAALVGMREVVYDEFLRFDNHFPFTLHFYSGDAPIVLHDLGRQMAAT